MNKWIVSAALATSVAVAAPASAAVVVTPPQTITLSSTGTGFFNAEHAAGDFLDEFRFDTGVGSVGTSVITLSFGGALIKLTSVALNGKNLLIEFDPVKNIYSASGSASTQVNPQSLKIGTTLTGSGTGSYTGQVKFTSSVPEPATWALMILGFGVVGYAMRRRPSVRFAQAI